MKNEGYKTRQRIAIKNALKEVGNRHITVDYLVDYLENKNVSVGRTTVYRCLENLVKEGSVRKYSASNKESVCYQFVEGSKGCGEHFHLKCEKCGKLFHIECEELSHIDSHIKKHHQFKINPLKTVFYGLCEKCGSI